MNMDMYNWMKSVEENIHALSAELEHLKEILSEDEKENV